MAEEEKKAINRIYDVTHQIDGSYVDYIDIDDTCNYEEDLDSCKGFCKAIDIVLGLIEKQQKEIEVLREENFDTVYMKAVADFKDKIRGKIEQLEIVKNTPVKDNNYTYKECIEYGIEELKEILEE